MDSANKRIAKNTIYMYIRLFTTTVIGLYTSRLVLEVLGVSDYGLFAVVGGVLAMFTFISNSLTGSTSRFLNTEMGKPDGDLNAMFNVNLLLHIGLALIIFILAETFGLWYIYNGLNVAEGKLDDAVFVYHVSIVTACLGIINSPYQSLFNAYERFRFTAILDIVNSVVRLGCVLMLTFCPDEGVSFSPLFSLSLLRLYAFIMMLTTANTFVIFHWVAYHDWPHIVKRRFVNGWYRYREVMVFGGWDTLSMVSYMIRSSGSDLTINKFFGTAVNGAYSIGRTVSNFTGMMAANINAAAAPQIIQAYSAGNTARYTNLTNKIGKYNILVYELWLFPLIIQLEFILRLWLGKVPEGAVEFAFWNLMISGMNVINVSTSSVIMASGKIKWFRIVFCSTVLIGLPISWLFLAMGLPPFTFLVIFLIADVVQYFIQLIMLRHIIGFDILRYLREAYTRPALIGIIMSFVVLFGHQLPITNVFDSLCLIALCLTITLFLIWYIGISRDERGILIMKIKGIAINRKDRIV